MAMKPTPGTSRETILKLEAVMQEFLDWANGKTTSTAPNGTDWIGYFRDKFTEALR